ncbi:MAG: S-methyl-5-thioribose-1-phosphate isomerase [Planctomycetes bacterium]|nr:S-methyl-5-thioribose-1-phosphate isomerase [Planctomycetota bacterium]
MRPLVWEKGRLLILDQTLLPHRERFLVCRTPDDVARAIRELRVRGAPLIGIAAAYGIALAGDAIDRAAALLISARPTAVNLAAAVRRVAAVGPRRILVEARRIHAEDAAMCAAIGRHGAKLVPPGARILTICNTGALATGGIGTAYAIIKRARNVTVYACETRPVWQGARLTLYEFAKDRIPAYLIADGAAAATMREKKIDLVVTGADRIARNGDTANKIGTYALALAARAHRIPFYVAAPRSTFDFSIADGRRIPIEERAEAEVLTAAPRGARAYNPAFDVTPARLITAFVTDAGVFPKPPPPAAGKVR